MKPEIIREDFPIFRRKVNGRPFIYFNNAATTQKPKQVLNAISDFYGKHNGSVHRGTSAISAEATEMYSNARKNVADFIGAKEQEIVYLWVLDRYCFNIIAELLSLRGKHGCIPKVSCIDSIETGRDHHDFCNP